MNKSNKLKDSDLPVSFEDTSISFQDKSDQELLLSYLIFGLTKSPFLLVLKFLLELCVRILLCCLCLLFLLEFLRRNYLDLHLSLLQYRKLLFRFGLAKLFL